MVTELNKLAPSKMSAAKTMYATFNILKAAGGQLQGKQVIEKIRETVEMNEWETQVYEKTGYVRWNLFYIFTPLMLLKPVSFGKTKEYGI